MIFGLYGGRDLKLNTIEIHYLDGTTYTTTKDLVENVPAGTELFQQAGRGGGYGDPFKRDAYKVAEEVRNGIISIKQAKDAYGVAIDAETFEVNLKETERIRARQ
jgi:N-methylhydantoinase B